ncbi:hypothetical protein GCM10022243_39340 [Saccharothrix violaceirubra]|uniref:Uncharacterized protein n=1 Tax=Saccharothrix violaceirubra TaxID=413306 RepID=A0A7W7T0D5_9PSEU|nr:hypothetical protein [Saccharothrix violaceirubra]MBB4964282.1 hypothetical protein [Saccharothrix violaceirubra]
MRRTRGRAELGRLRREAGHDVDDTRLAYHRALCYLPPSGWAHSSTLYEIETG